jgi:hypothetical protein
MKTEEYAAQGEWVTIKTQELGRVRYLKAPSNESAEHVARTLNAAQEMLEALQGYVAHIESCRAAWEEDGAERNTKMHGLAVALNNIFGDRIEKAIAKATNEPVMAA